MAEPTDIYKILAAVNPKEYSSNPDELKKLIKAGKFDEAIKQAKPKAIDL